MAPLEIRTFPGAGGGMDLAGPIHMLADSKARFIIDGLVDQPGLVRQRGKIKGTQIATQSPYGLMATNMPDGTLVLGALVSDDTTVNHIQFIDKNNGALGFYNIGGNVGAIGPLSIWQSTPLLKGPGVAFGFATSLTNPIFLRGLGFWRGGTKATYATGTITATRGSKIVTGAGTTWSSNLTAGMFMFKDNGAGLYTYLGVIKSVDSNTQVTLEENSLYSAAAASAYSATAIRGYNPRVAVGRISGAAGQATINGTGTKFGQIGPTSTWTLWRARDMTFIGDVSTITTDTQLVLVANVPALADTANDKYLAIANSGPFSVLSPGQSFGILSATWQGRQFYAHGGVGTGNESRLWYSDVDDFEALDLSNDGWNLDITSTEEYPQPIFALLSTEPALLVFKEAELFQVAGTSADPTTWSVKKVTDNGTLCPMSVVAYKGGAIWASDRGIFSYDGTSLTNLTADSLGDYWTKALVNFNPDDHRMWAFVERDHYFLHVEGITLPQGWFKGSTEVKPTNITICINLATQALTFLTNVGIRGAAFISAIGTQESTTRFLVEKGSDASSYIAKGKTLFLDNSASADQGVDDFICSGHQTAPDFYLESARYDMDDPQLRKLWKQVQIHYISSTKSLNLDVVTNFDTIGTTTSSALPISATFVNKRLKFLKRSQLLGFRLYSRSTADSTVDAEVQLGPWAIGFKRQRPGRV